MILVLSQNEEVVSSWRHHLFSRGLCSVSCTATEAMKTHLEETAFDAVLIPDLSQISLSSDFYGVWHRRHPHTPLVLLVGGEDVLPRLETGILTLSKDHLPSKIIDLFIYEVSAFHGRDICQCIAECARDHLLMPHALFGGIPLHLTPIERMIFRYLIHTYPRAITAKELYRNCIKPGTSPTLQNIFTHIYNINRKGRATFGVPLIVKTSPAAYHFNMMQK